MAAAMAAVKAEPAKLQETVFPLPQSSRGGAGKKPRNIDLMLENLKRWVAGFKSRLLPCDSPCQL